MQQILDNLNELLDKKEYNKIISYLKEGGNLNLINIYSFEEKTIIELFNNVIIPMIKEDIENNINIDSFIFKYKNILENIYQLFNLYLRNYNNKELNKIKLEEIEYLFQIYIKNYMENEIYKNNFVSQEEFYQKIKKINIFVNLYITTNYQFLTNISTKNENNFLISNKLKNFVFEIFIQILEINKKIVEKNKIFISNLYYKHDGFKHLLPFYFYYLLFLLVTNYKFTLNDINLKLKDNILNFIETIENNPFYLINLLPDKTIAIIISYLIVYNEYIKINFLKNNKHKIIFFDIKYKRKILKIHYINLFYFANEMIGNKNLIQELETNFQNYSYISLLFFKKLKIKLEEMLNLEFLNDNYYIEYLNLFLKYNYNKNLNIENINNLLELKINFNFHLNLFYLILMLQNYILIENIEELKKLLEGANIKVFENYIINHSINLNKYSKEKYNNDNYYNYELLNLYIFLKISIFKKEFDKLINEIIYSIKFYKIKKFNDLVKELQNNFLLNKGNILYFTLKAKILSTEEVLELFELNEIKNYIKNNELLLVELILNIKNKNIKENKNFIEYIIKLQKEKKSQEIEDALKLIGLKFNSKYIILPEN